MGEGYTVKHWDDFETLEGSGGATWRLARKSLDGEAFGFNVVDIEPGGELPPHTEAGESPQEEVYAVLEGEAVFVAGEDEYPAPAGTFIRLKPEVNRSIRNDSDAVVRCIAIGVPTGSGYESPGWA